MQRVHQQRDQDPRLAFQKGRTKEGGTAANSYRAKGIKSGRLGAAAEAEVSGRSGVWPSALLTAAGMTPSEVPK